MTIPRLCVGGPLDGQYRAAPDEAISFFAAAIPPMHELSAAQAAKPAAAVRAKIIEYQLVWSSEHDRMVWWCAS